MKKEREREIATNLRLTIQCLVFVGVWQDILLNYHFQSTNKYH
jgi:hypothetical protein